MAAFCVAAHAVSQRPGAARCCGCWCSPPGFRAALGIAIIEPYDTYIPYEVYIIPGLACMILLFNGMQGSLSMVYDREMGSMRVLLTSPLPGPFCCAANCWRRR